MDKSWIYEQYRTSHKFLQGVTSFIEFAKNSSISGKLPCPCQRCVNCSRHTPDTVFNHILQNGFSPGYTYWCFHGESISSTQNPGHSHDAANDLRQENVGGQRNNVRQFFEDMAIGYDQMGEFGSNTQSNGDDSYVSDHDMQPPMESLNEEAKKFYNLLDQTDEELFSGCRKHSKLSFILELFHIKNLHGWSNESFKELLSLLRETLPEGDKLPGSTYEVKKLINALGLGYKMIDVCPNNCMLFWKTDIDQQKCTKCGAYRYKEDEIRGSCSSAKKKNQLGKKVLRWFPLIPRLQRLFMCPKTAYSMRWHFDERKDDGYVRHPADGRAWKEFDNKYSEFAKEPRNLRLGLASDGFNPFRNLSSTHSTWPVILTIYNWPPWLCMKQSSFIMPLLIPGPESPGKNIDVFLEPVVEELHVLWTRGIDTYDAHSKTMFKLHASLLWTISDFPGYGMLSGWGTHSEFGCPCCGLDTWSKRLKNGGKFCFMGHRRHLASDHRFRRDKERFDGTEEFRTTPVRMTGTHVLELLDSNSSTIEVNGELIEAERVKKACKRKSIFFRLPYWKFNLVRHNLDLMHIEKNVCDNILNTILNIKGKTKDNLKARQDLKEMDIRKGLHPIKKNGKDKIPSAYYVMVKREKVQMLATLKKMKVPDSYSSNISSCVKTDAEKLMGLKSHDCHVLLHDLLPVAVRGCLHDKVSKVVIDLSTYLREMCSKVFEVSRLDVLQAKIGEILARMEIIFPPSFFTIMVHLVYHLAEEVKLAGPIHYRWMYPIERYLMTLKAHVRNKNYPEASIAEWYIANESIEYCSRYFTDVNTRFNRVPRNDDEPDHVQTQDTPVNTAPGRAFGKVKDLKLDYITKMQAHRYVLYNCDEVQPFIKDHQLLIEEQYGSKSRKRRRLSGPEIEQVHHLKFVEWFKDRVSELEAEQDPRATDHVKWLARGPLEMATRFCGYITKGSRFRTKAREENKKTQNSGVVVASKTSNSADNTTYYYGRVVDMIELNYYERFRVVLFKCEWVDVENRKGIKKDKFGYTLVNFSRLIHTGSHLRDEPFVFASQVEPVFYVEDSQEPGWSVVLRTKPRDAYDMDHESGSYQPHIDVTYQSASTSNEDFPSGEEENWNRSGVQPRRAR